MIPLVGLLAEHRSLLFAPLYATLSSLHYREFAPIDPTEHDRSITLAFNKKTNQFEPIVIAAVERSFEFLHSSPVDVHNFDVLPVVRHIE